MDKKQDSCDLKKENPIKRGSLEDFSKDYLLGMYQGLLITAFMATGSEKLYSKTKTLEEQFSHTKNGDLGYILGISTPGFIVLSGLAGLVYKVFMPDHKAL